MQRKVVIAISALVLAAGVLGALVLAACGGDTGSTGAREESSAPAAAATGEPLKIGFDEGFTGFMAVDAQLTEHGIKVALEEVGNQWMGRPIEYYKADNASDPVQAVDKARQLVENNGIQVMLGPIFSPSNAAVTDYLAKGGGGIPSISIFGQPSDNLKTGNELSFIPAGMMSQEGYLLGKYAVETLGYKTANAISLEDTTGHELMRGFQTAFEEGGGKIVSNQYVPIDTVDFSSYLTTLKPADCTYNWIFGNGTGPFIKQYHDYGLEAPLIMTMADDLQEPVMQELGDLSLGIIGSDHYLSTVDNELNNKFVAEYEKMWPGELPNMDSYGGYTAVMMFLEAVKATGGDTSPEALKQAMATMTFDTPNGPITMSAYDSVFIGTADFYIGKTELVDGNYRWMPVQTYDQILMKNPW
jgi:branched-chain amino acid transport system substrate-binding protein